MSPQKRAAGRPEVDDGDWAPRRRQRARLAELEARLAREAAGEQALALEIERAALLATLGRRQDAQTAFVAILRKAPTHFGALNEFGGLLTGMGAIDAACRVYSEAILHHPDNPTGHINLANLLLRANKHDQARGHYQTALRLDPDHPQAHQGLGAVLADLGDRIGASAHFARGFRGHAVSALPYRGDTPPIRLLQLVSSGGGNIPTGLFLDDTKFLTTVVVADHLEAATPLPPHQLIFNTIGDADLCGPALAAACRLAAQAKVPVINDPRAVLRSGRIGNARRLRDIAGVVTPQTLSLPRDRLAGPDAGCRLAAQGFRFPLLLRSPGYHTGRNFILVTAPGDLAAAAVGLPGEEVLVIEYLDARGSDGNARKYRVMMIDGGLYPLHLAISENWKVHYFTSDMADRPGHREEEAAFLADMPAVLGARAMAALEAIRERLGLDYAGVDFALNADGDLLLFEANATMVIARPRDEPRWAYRQGAIDRALAAALAMLVDRSGVSAQAAAG